MIVRADQRDYELNAQTRAEPSSPVRPHNALDELYAKLARRNIPSLDGLRAIAISLVILYHFDIPPNVPGPMGVTIFFVLSGFLITWLLLREASREGSVSLPQFYKRRFLRIFPAFYVYWLICAVVLQISGNTTHWTEMFSAFSYTSNYYYTFGHSTRPVMPFTWSLAVEEQFYILWPCLFCALFKNLRTLTHVLCGIILSVWVYRFIAYFGAHASFLYLQHSFETRADHLLLGALLAVLLERRVLAGFFRFVCSSRLAPAISIALLAASVCCEHLFNGFDYRHTIGYIIEPIVIAILLVQLVVLGEAGIWRWINWPVTRLAGRLSYSLYLYHFSAARVAAYLLPNVHWRYELAGRFLAGIIAAVASYYIIELPFLRLKGRSASGSGSAATRNDSPKPPLVLVSTAGELSGSGL